jgi:L-2-hydroxyglutarate oxidase
MSPGPRVIVVGGGIVGLAVAYTLLQRHPDARVQVLEKEPGVGHHQSGRNSGVIHSGVYYKPGSLKAVNCRRGKRMLEEFCARYDIPFEICGKVIVAVENSELSRLETIAERALANGCPCRVLSRDELAEVEPHAAGVRALHVQDTGITDYRRVCEKLAELIAAAGGQVLTSTRVTAARSRTGGIVLSTTRGEHEADFLIACAGLHSDRVARARGSHPARSRRVLHAARAGSRALPRVDLPRA